MATFHVMAGAGETIERPEVRRIHVSDVWDALRAGFGDFWEKPSHIVFLAVIYPVVGVFLAAWTAGQNAFWLLYPLMSGFALLGPVAAIGLYEISRRRELGLDTSWTHAFEVRNSPALPAIVAVGVLLVALFIAWLLVAQGLYAWLFGLEPPASLGSFIDDVLTTWHGWALIVLGNGIGFLFAVVALSVSVVSFPLLLDRDVGAVCAIQTSVRTVMPNPVPMAVWGLIVAGLLVLGSIPLFAGLAVVLPILGHATWHVYRRTVVPPQGVVPRAVAA